MALCLQESAAAVCASGLGRVIVASCTSTFSVLFDLMLAHPVAASCSFRCIAQSANACNVSMHSQNAGAPQQQQHAAAVETTGIHKVKMSASAALQAAAAAAVAVCCSVLRAARRFAGNNSKQRGHTLLPWCYVVSLLDSIPQQAAKQALQQQQC